MTDALSIWSGAMDALDAQPRVPLAHLPTPLESMPRLGSEIGADLWIKRDDCTGLAFGGNKTRKLEFAIGAALAEGADTMIASSGYQSNYIRQAAAASARLGFEFHGVIAEPPPGRPRHYFSSGNLLLDELLGAQLHVAADEGPATDAVVARISAEIRRRGKTPAHLLKGASQAIGALGYVDCARELLTQCAAEGFEPGTVFVVTGGGGGLAGLSLGFSLLGVKTRVIGVSCSEPAAAKRAKATGLIAEMARRLGVEIESAACEVEVTDAYTGGGYAVPTDAANQAIRRTARAEGVILDPIYTGKGMAALLDMVTKAEVDRSKPIVFLHSGGGPALFVYDDLFWKGAPLP